MGKTAIPGATQVVGTGSGQVHPRASNNTELTSGHLSIISSRPKVHAHRELIAAGSMRAASRKIYAHHVLFARPREGVVGNQLAAPWVQDKKIPMGIHAGFNLGVKR